MPRKEQTTVNLTKLAQAIKDNLAPVYGLKNILSAGLYLFGNLTSDEQKNIIKIVSDNFIPEQTGRTYTPLTDAIKNIVESEKAKKTKPNVVIHLSPSDIEGWEILNKIACIESKRNKKKISKTG